MRPALRLTLSAHCDTASAHTAIMRPVALSPTSIFHLRQPSLARGILFPVLAFLVSLRLGGFPDINALHSSRWQLIPIFMTCAGMVDLARCLGHRWSLYHAGVLIFLYTSLMILAMGVFLFFFP
jgi:hypothetical protein